MEKNRQKQSAILVTAVNILAVFFAGIYLVSLSFQFNKSKDVVSPVVLRPLKPNPFLSIPLEAESVYVLDAMTGEVLYSKNSESQVPLASVTKVMTALVASHVSEETVIRIRPENLSDGLGGLVDGEWWNLKNLLDYTLVISSNSGANAIAGATGAILAEKNNKAEQGEKIFIKEMNSTAQKLGLTQTFYLNPSGLDMNENLSGAYGSAKDMTRLFAYILKTKPSLLGATAYNAIQYQSLNGVSHRAENTNIIARSVPGLIASKTGYTDLANGNLVIAFDVGPMHPVIIAVLGSSQDGRFTDVQKLVDASIAKISQGE